MQRELNGKWLNEEIKNSSSQSERLGLIKFYSSGIPIYSSLAKLWLESIENTITSLMEKVGFHKIDLPSMQLKTDWEKSGRYESYAEKFETSKYILSATAEEVASIYSDSFKGDDISFFQISKKFRNELRPRTLSRCREFYMKDAYSFHSSENSSLKYLRDIHQVYLNFFELIKVPVSVVSSSDVAMGGNLSFEYCLEDDNGEGSIWFEKGSKEGINYQAIDCPKDGLTMKKVHELGHIFYLGDKYSKAMSTKLKYACSYGIGLTRLLECILSREQALTWYGLKSSFMAVSIGEINIDLPILKLSVKRGSNVNYPFTFASKYFKGVPLIWESSPNVFTIRTDKDYNFKDLNEVKRFILEWRNISYP